MEKQLNQIINLNDYYKDKGYRLELTSPAYPEQYDVFKNNKKVGYLHLRHGIFTVDYPDCGGLNIWSTLPGGDGIFNDDERVEYLKEAVRIIDIEIGNQNSKTRNRKSK